MSFLASDTAAPFFRLIMELSAWIWLILTIFQAQTLIAQLTAVGLLIFSMGGLGLLNYPGDKKPVEDGVIGIAVPGKVRVILEFITAFLGLFFSLLLLGINGAVLQLIIIILYLRLDNDRIAWMWGFRTHPPEYVTKIHQYSKTNRVAEKEKIKRKRNR